MHLGLLLALTVCSAGCAQKLVTSNCPAFPIPSKQVAEELQANCYPETKCPATWQWIDRLYVLKDSSVVEIKKAE
ncbi:MAG: hypothetical protein K0M45_00275 [Candidatus Paracaedibacteraceae bacterium]|nr:hypothetical protein [Candidatus Paracaedibacteraceae bacterium]